LIRQAISCDICGNEKRQTNHWFVAYDQAGELRVSGWNSRNRLRAGTKHLCGQICLHKLVDEFLARTLATRITPDPADPAELPAGAASTETSLVADVQILEEESSARVIPTPQPTPPSIIPPPIPPKRLPQRAQPELVPTPSRPLPAALPQEAPRIASKAWRSEAWQRERARELRDGTRSPDVSMRRLGS
jgi:hypothetical protein